MGINLVVIIELQRWADLINFSFKHGSMFTNSCIYVITILARDDLQITGFHLVGLEIANFRSHFGDVFKFQFKVRYWGAVGVVTFFGTV